LHRICGDIFRDHAALRPGHESVRRGKIAPKPIRSSRIAFFLSAVPRARRSTRLDVGEIRDHARVVRRRPGVNNESS
jgi:hypothetical protein